MRLHPDATATRVRLIVLDEAGSTNTEALALARRGKTGPLWITAGRQTAGRGRRGRAWISEPGNLYATLLLTDAPSARAAELSFVAALALHDAVTSCAPALASRLSLKWPNDLLLDGAKLAGILVEGEAGEGPAFAAAIGIGINCASHPGLATYPATSLAAAGTSTTPATLFEALSGAMARRHLAWDHGAAFAAIRTEWLLRAVGLAQQIRVRVGDRELAGRFEALDAAGRLVLRMPGGAAEIITAGEVFGLSDRAAAPATLA